MPADRLLTWGCGPPCGWTRVGGGRGGRRVWERRKRPTAGRPKCSVRPPAGKSSRSLRLLIQQQRFTPQFYLAQVESENRMWDKRKRERTSNSIIEYSIIV